jgi:hypothetical protein
MKLITKKKPDANFNGSYSGPMPINIKCWTNKQKWLTIKIHIDSIDRLWAIYSFVKIFFKTLRHAIPVKVSKLKTIRV